MTTPTKSPWIFNAGRGDIIAPSVKREDSRIGCGDARDYVWNYYGGEVVAETVAGCDGPLLSAAPELLEALMELRLFMWSGGYADQTVAMAKADAAIAKAEGR